eukprot:7190728-Heterocapsa_arctica.AAC.1
MLRDDRALDLVRDRNARRLLVPPQGQLPGLQFYFETCRCRPCGLQDALQHLRPARGLSRFVLEH